MRPLPTDCRVTAAVTFLNTDGPAPARLRLAREHMRHQLADTVARSEHLSTTADDLSTTYFLDVYVLSAAQLGELIQREAERIAYRMTPP